MRYRVEAPAYLNFRPVLPPIPDISEATIRVARMRHTLRGMSAMLRLRPN
jgi:hypothetical protein